MTDTIATVTPYVIPAEPVGRQWWARKPYVLVRVETRDGIVGWGECHHLSYREDALVASVHQLSQWTVDRPAHDIRAFTHEAFGKFGQQRPGVEVYGAFAGIEIALWIFSANGSTHRCIGCWAAHVTNGFPCTPTSTHRMFIPPKPMPILQPG